MKYFSSLIMVSDSGKTNLYERNEKQHQVVIEEGEMLGTPLNSFMR